jgi:hypothetical protein
MLPAAAAMLAAASSLQREPTTRRSKLSGNMPDRAGRMPALPFYTPRLNSNRYSSNRIIAPMIDMIQPAT